MTKKEQKLEEKEKRKKINRKNMALCKFHAYS
jgi:hypothetical protein